ncbi:hypothetical protein IEO21_00677 [Rhodonia placenta]|uniref:Uncharacterized protein n=1 Tax=Rhodonia placenta TaxID=104341 RepID=A0A8H7PB43_9APHY|nr:hypothetical protein IEO21_00677 [Postia placenta]
MAAPFSVIFSRAFLVLKLVPKMMTDTFVILADGQDGQNNAKSGSNDADAMVLDSGAGPSADTSKRISTHGPRDSRREQWRLSKGMPARSISKGVNRQGGVAAKRKAGRSHRRR